MLRGCAALARTCQIAPPRRDVGREKRGKSGGRSRAPCVRTTLRYVVVGLYKPAPARAASWCRYLRLGAVCVAECLLRVTLR